MITDVDIRKLQKVFDTKQESKKRHKETLKRFDNLDKRVSSVEQKVTELTEFVVPAIGNILEWTDDIHRAIVGKPSKRVSGN